jgi:hypothetical protein
MAASLLRIGTAGLAVAYGIEVWMWKTNPLMDVPSAEFQKTVNATTVRQGDIVRVNLFIGWHGHVLPEFTRHVKVVDPYPEDCLILVTGSNTYEYNGAGPGPGFTYTLKVVGGQGKTLQLPQPKFYLDDVEIPLNGESPSLQIS